MCKSERKSGASARCSSSRAGPGHRPGRFALAPWIRAAHVAFAPAPLGSHFWRLWQVVCGLSQLKQAQLTLLFWQMSQITPKGLTPITALSQTVMGLCLFIKLVSSFTCPIFLKGLNSPLVEEKNKTNSAKAQAGPEPSAHYSAIFSEASGPSVPCSIPPLSLGLLQLRCCCWPQGTEEVIGAHIHALSVPSFPTFGNAPSAIKMYLLA